MTNSRAMSKRRNVNLDKGGCLCWETSTYHPDCCDPDDRYAEHIGRTRGPIENESDEPEEPHS